MVIVFAGMMIHYGWKMAALQVMTSQKTIILQIPLVYLYALLPITGVMMMFRTLYVIWLDLTEQSQKSSN
jgi:TRAP-type C4-dicarboxylate transport system permease small subunit